MGYAGRFFYSGQDRKDFGTGRVAEFKGEPDRGPWTWDRTSDGKLDEDLDLTPCTVCGKRLSIRGKHLCLPCIQAAGQFQGRVPTRGPGGQSAVAVAYIQGLPRSSSFKTVDIVNALGLPLSSRMVAAYAIMYLRNLGTLGKLSSDPHAPWVFLEQADQEAQPHA